MQLYTCRFCKDIIWSREDQVRYGIRHVAHHRCYLEAGKSLSDLLDWQIVRFPHRLILEFRLESEAKAAYDRLHAAKEA